jgi:hypothetical protein
MNRNLAPIDISSQPDIRRLAEEVQATKTPRVLQRDNESIAVVMPLAPAVPAQGTNIWENYNAERVRDALRESAGALAGVDKEALLSDIKAARRQETQHRPY